MSLYCVNVYGNVPICRKQNCLIEGHLQVEKLYHDSQEAHRPIIIRTVAQRCMHGAAAGSRTSLQVVKFYCWKSTACKDRPVNSTIQLQIRT